MVGASLVLALAWYLAYGRSRSSRVGAIYHIFERWGQAADRGLEREISAAMQSHGLRVQDRYPSLIASASVISLSEGETFAEAAQRSSEVLGRRLGVDPTMISSKFFETGSLWIRTTDELPTATPIAFFDGDDEHLVIARSSCGITIPVEWGGHDETVDAVFFLAGCERHTGRALRLAGELADYLAAEPGSAMARATNEGEVKAALLPELDIVQYTLMVELPAGRLIGQRVGDLLPPSEIQLEAVRREGRVLRIDDDLVLEADDQLTVIGPCDRLPDPDELHRLLIRS